MTKLPLIHRLEDTYPLSYLAEPCVEILRQEMTTDLAHDEGHIVRVVRNALWFCPDGNPDIIIPSALLHDLVNVPKEDRINRKHASRMSAELAVQRLTEKNLPFKLGEIIALIGNAIECHSFSANVPCRSREACAVQDADRIDSLGMIGIARCLGTSGKMGRALFDSFDPAAEERELDDYAYGLDHFKVKLFGLASTMKTDRGRFVANRLTDKMKTFYNAIVREINGSDIENLFTPSDDDEPRTRYTNRSG